MTRLQITTEINKLLENTADSVLSEVLSYLKSTQNKPEDAIALSQNVRRVLTEDKELLERLAK